MRSTLVPVHALTHPLTGAPITPIGHRANGRPIWPILGGDDTVTPGAPTDTDTTDDGDTDTGDKDGDDKPDGDKPRTYSEAYVKKLRAENASHRTKVAKVTADQQSVMDTVAKALGLKPDAADPAALAEQLKAKDTEARTARIELAVHKRAGTHQGDPAALLDSRSFAKAVAELDPTASDFDAQVDAAIKVAVKDNPKLKAAAAGPTRSGADLPGGPGNTAKRPTSLGAAISKHYGT